MKIAQVGTFDIENYGDLLFPLVLERRLEHAGLEVVAVSPTRHDGVWNDCRPCISFAELEARADEFDGFVIGGGNIIHASPTSLRAYDRGGAGAILTYAELWIGTTALAARTGAPVVWNAPGVPAAIPAELSALAEQVLLRASYVSVRDEASAARLRCVTDRPVVVVSDTAVDVAELWTPEELEAAVDGTFARASRERPAAYLTVHLKERYLHEDLDAVAAQLDQVARSTGRKLVFLAIGPCHGDDALARDVASRLHEPPLVVERPQELREIAALIARSDAYLGSSLHGAVTACAFSVPSVVVASRRVEKFAGFLEPLGLDASLVESWQIAAATIDRVLTRPREVWSTAAARARCGLDEHWRALAAGLASPPGEARLAASRPIAASDYRAVVAMASAVQSFRRVEELKVAQRYASEKAHILERDRDLLQRRLGEIEATMEALPNPAAIDGEALARAAATERSLRRDLAAAERRERELLAQRETGLRARLDACCQDVERLHVWGRQALAALEWILGSRTWRSGDRVVSILARRRTRREPFTAPDDARLLGRELAERAEAILGAVRHTSVDARALDAAYSPESHRDLLHALEESIRSASATRERMVLVLHAICRHVEHVLSTHRWKIGRSAMGAAKAMLLRPGRRAWAPESFRRVVDEFRRWHAERTGGEVGGSLEGSATSGRAAAPPRAALLELPVTILVPIHDAHDAVRECIESVLRHTARRHRVLLLDDASSDPRIPPLLASFAESHANVEVHRSPVNLGYTANVNRGLRLAPGDCVLLNSDTRVTRGWLRKLRLTAASRPDVATVTPLSNAAGAFSVPKRGVVNDLPPGLDDDTIAHWVEQLSERKRPEAPTGNGFCMYMTRGALDRVGSFDEAAFPRGYGEENDFAMRAKELGFVHLVDDSTWIFHRRSASFGEEKAGLLAAGRETIRTRHPSYKRLVTEWLARDDFAELGTRLEHAFAGDGDLLERTRPCLLYIVHDGQGGTRFTSEDLASRVAGTFRCLLLRASLDRWTLLEHDGHALRLLAEYEFDTPWQLEHPLDTARLEVLRRIASREHVALVHLRHFLAVSPEIVGAIEELDIPVIFSFHDFFCVCPTIQLIDDKERYCGGHCTPGDGACSVSKNWLRRPPHLKHGYVHEWRERVAAALARCTAFVTTSTSTRAILVEHFPFLDGRAFRVIEHGRDLTEYEFRPTPPGNPARVVVTGALGVAKGIRLLGELLRINQREGSPFEFHFLGNLHGDFRPEALGGICHGAYRREELPRRLGSIRASFSIIASIWPETFCHTLTESWAAGLPVFASDLGALGERIERFGGGWRLDPGDPEAWFARMVEVLRSPDAYEARVREIRAMTPTGLDEMADEYLKLYASLGIRT